MNDIVACYERPDGEDVDGYWHVPKKDLVDAFRLLYEQKRMRMPAALFDGNFDGGKSIGATLLQEAKDFRYKITAAANATFNAREGKHDDLLLAVAQGCWWAERAKRCWD